MTKKIRLAAGVDLPAAEIATEVTAAIGIRGSGKSNALAVLAEGMLGAGLQVVVLDPVGLWFSLRLDAGGKSPSPYRIHVLGGRHADLDLLPQAGRVVATGLARTGASAVLDVSGFSKADRCRFAADFAEQLLRDKKEHQGPLWLVLEEAQTFAPQVIRHGLEYMGRMLGAFEEMAEVGRNFGLGLGLASQRPQKVNKEVLNLAENVLAFRLLGSLERKAVRDWVQERDAPGRAEVDGMLPSLNRGEAIIWSPVRGIYQQAGTPRKSTYDAGATPLAARERVQVGALDLGALREAMAQVVADVEANDPRKLRARVADLERQLAQRVPPVGRVEIPSLGAVLTLQRAHRGVDAALTEVANAGQSVARVVTDLKEAFLAVERERNLALQDGPAAPTPPRPSPVGKAHPGANGAAGGPSLKPGASELGPGALRVLNALAESHRALTWPQARMLAGMVESGTSSQYRADLIRAGLVEDRGGLLHLTERGAGIAEPADLPRTARELLDRWRAKLPGKAGEMLQNLVERGPAHRGDLIASVGLTESGTSGRYVSLLLTYGLADRVGNKLVASSMFAEVG